MDEVMAVQVGHARRNLQRSSLDRRDVWRPQLARPDHCPLHEPALLHRVLQATSSAAPAQDLIPTRETIHGEGNSHDESTASLNSSTSTSCRPGS